MAANSCTVSKPESVKDILDLMSKVSKTNGLRESVYHNILSRMARYMNRDRWNKYYIGGTNSSSTEHIPRLFKGVDDIRNEIIINPGSEDSYGKYKNLCTNSNDAALINDISSKVINALPRLYSSLYYLYFNGHSDMKTFKGGSWSETRFNESGKGLHKWLTGNGTYGGFPGGYLGNSNLGSKTGNFVASKVKDILDETNEKPLQHVLRGTMFLTDSWDDALLGHSLGFLYEYCVNYSNDKWRLRTASASSLESSCEALKDNLYDFLRVDKSGTVTTSRKNFSMYLYFVDSSAVGYYNNWLKRNMEHIVKSLRDMSNECSKWDTSNINDVVTPGPFKYGLVFNDGNWEGKVKEELPKTVLKVTDSAGSLKAILESSKGMETEIISDTTKGPPVRPVNGNDLVIPQLPNTEGYHDRHSLANENHANNGLLHGYKAPEKGSFATDLPIMPFALLMTFLISRIF